MSWGHSPGTSHALSSSAWAGGGARASGPRAGLGDEHRRRHGWRFNLPRHLLRIDAFLGRV
eukprot:2248696-Pyramimonas_sp.AAC.1